MRVQAIEDPHNRNFVRVWTRDPHGMDAYGIIWQTIVKQKQTNIKHEMNQEFKRH